MGEVAGVSSVTGAATGGSSVTGEAAGGSSVTGAAGAGGGSMVPEAGVVPGSNLLHLSCTKAWMGQAFPRVPRHPLSLYPPPDWQQCQAVVLRLARHLSVLLPPDWQQCQAVQTLARRLLSV